MSLSPIAKLTLEGLHGIAKLLARTGFSGIRRMGEAMGALLWHCLPARRRLAIDAIKHHLKFDEQEATRIARASFGHNGRSFFEILLAGQFGFHLAKTPHPDGGRPPFSTEFSEQITTLRIVGVEQLNAMVGHEGPIVGITGHIGAWELLAGLLAEYGDQKPRMVVMRRNKNKVMNELIMRLRGARGLEVLDHRRAVFTVLKGLKRNGVAAFLVDHNCSRDEAIFLPFLGDLAAVNMGPALLALRAEALVWPVFLVREAGGYIFHINAPLDTRTLEGDRQEKIAAIAGFYTQAAEDIVRRYPEQWFWMHKRWKTRPETEA